MPFPRIGSHCAKLMWKQMKHRSQQAGSYLKGDRASPWQGGDGDSITVVSHKLFWLQSEPKDLQYCHSLLPLSLVAYLFISKDQFVFVIIKKLLGFFSHIKNPLNPKDTTVLMPAEPDSSSKKTYELSLFLSYTLWQILGKVAHRWMEASQVVLDRLLDTDLT